MMLNKKSHHLYPLFPDLIENQKKSVRSFWEKGILEEFDLFSYVVGKRKNLFMIFHGSKFFLQKPLYSLKDILQYQKTYSVSLFIPIEFQYQENHQLAFREAQLQSVIDSRSENQSAKPIRSKRNPIDEVDTADIVAKQTIQPRRILPVYFGEIPLMTERGNFLINGSGRVLVNQIVRCPSVYFKVKIDQKNRRTYIASFLSEYGSWLRLETDYRNRVWVRIDKSQRFSIYALLRSLGFPESFLKYQSKNYSFLVASQEEYFPSSPHESIQAIWKKFTPNRWNSLSGCYSFFYTKFFNPRRYSIGEVGRFRLNKRLGRSVGSSLCESGEAKKQQSVSKIPTLTPEDIFLALELLIDFHYGESNSHLDDIDHLKNRRVRLPGELMQNQLRLALSRITQFAVDKISKFEIEIAGAADAENDSLDTFAEQFRSANEVTIVAKQRTIQNSAENVKNFIQTQIFSSTFRELFNTSQLSQYMDQTNPLAEITHKRRLSSLGPGGIGRDQAGFAVREIHPSHFGRICPIETPEGQNAGLVGSLVTYCKINSHGFLESPYIKPFVYFSRSVIGEADIPNQLSKSIVTISRSGNCEANLREAKTILSNKENQTPSFLNYWFYFLADIEDKWYVSSERIVENTFVARIGLDTQTTRSELDTQTTQSELDTKYPDRQPFAKRNMQSNKSERVFRILDSRSAIGEADIRNQGEAKQSMEQTYQKNEKWEKYPVRYKQEFFSVPKNTIQFFGISPVQMISLATSLIPFLEHDDANRALMGSNMQRQAVPLLISEKAFLGTGLEIQSARDSSTLVLASKSGQINYLDGKNINYRKSGISFANYKTDSVSDSRFSSNQVLLSEYWRSNQSTCIRQSPKIKVGDWVEKGDLLADGAASFNGEVALGKNICVAYIPWEGYNFEDAIVISEKLVREDIYTSIHIDRYEVEARETEYGKEKITADFSGSSLGTNSEMGSESIEQGSLQSGSFDIKIEENDWVMPDSKRSVVDISTSSIRFEKNLDLNGIVKTGVWVEENDILVGKLTPISPPKPTPEYRLLLAIFETRPLSFKETSLRVPNGVEGRVLDSVIFRAGLANTSSKEKNIPATSAQHGAEHAAQHGTRYSARENNTITRVFIFLAHKRKIQLGDKMSGRHGNKGIVSLILPPEDMPFLPDGVPVDIVLNPLGVPSRMNVGQVLECLCGLASKYLSEIYRLLPFDEIYGEEASRGLVYQKLFESSLRTGYKWLFDPNHPGKSFLFDGRTGEAFHQPILVGYSYILKLIHLVDEKMHARSTGPYSLITQQPLGGRSKHGGQRLGEMEVWALQGFGAASILHEFLTLKSDDIDARNTFLFHLMKRKTLEISFVNSKIREAKPSMNGLDNFAEQFRSANGVTIVAKQPSERTTSSEISTYQSLPESFRVLVHELQSLCLSVYYNPDFRLTYPSLLGWDGLFLLSSKKLPTVLQLKKLKID